MSATSLFLRAVSPPSDWDDARATPAALVRARVFDAIVRAVAEKGYATTTVADVTARSRISRRTFYEYFSDKEDGFLRAYESASHTTLSEIAEATRELPAEDWRGRLHVGLETYLGILADDPALARVTLLDILGAGPKGLELREQVLQHYTDFYRRLAARAFQAGAISPVSEVFLRGLVGAIAEIVQREILGGRVRELRELVPTLEKLALVMIGAEAA